MDRDAKFSEDFRVTLQQVGTEAVRLPPRSPDLNPNLERFMRSVKEECLERMVLSGRDRCMPPLSLFWPIITQNVITRRLTTD